MFYIKKVFWNEGWQKIAIICFYFLGKKNKLFYLCALTQRWISWYRYVILNQIIGSRNAENKTLKERLTGNKMYVLLPWDVLTPITKNCRPLKKFLPITARPNIMKKRANVTYSGFSSKETKNILNFIQWIIPKNKVSICTNRGIVPI